MYGKPIGVLGGGVAGGGTLAYTGFPTAAAILLGLALIVIGLLLVRATYLRRPAHTGGSGASGSGPAEGGGRRSHGRRP